MPRPNRNMRLTPSHGVEHANDERRTQGKLGIPSYRAWKQTELRKIRLAAIVADLTMTTHAR